MDILNKFTTHLKNTLAGAVNFVLAKRKEWVKPEHLLWSLAQQKGSLGSEILNKCGFKLENLKRIMMVEDLASLDINPVTALPKFAPKTKRILEKAAIAASQYKHRYIGTEHLLWGVIKLKDKEIERMLIQTGVNLEELKQHLKIVLKSTSRFPDLTEFFQKPEPASIKKRGKEAVPTPALDFFGKNLTSQEVQKDIDPVIGREQEIERLIHILSRRIKNNPVLVGDPGVGKTAIVEGLAKRILEGNVPEVLINKKIYNLDLSLVVAGTIYRGEFEARMRQIIDEVKSDPNIILFIDEIHLIIGTGSTSGSMDAANILKPALAKGEIRCIGATTLEEYRKYIESDPALERRFQPIIVEEATPEETREILEGIKENYEKYHKVKITPQAIEAAINLSARYLQDRFLPDKAIDLIDEAASQIKVGKRPGRINKKIKEIEKEIIKLEKKKDSAVHKEDFNLAIRLKSEQERLHRELKALQEKSETTKAKYIGKIGKKEIAQVVSRITKIPLTELLTEEKEKLLHLEKLLAQKIVGQNEALKNIADLIRRARAGIVSPQRPIGSFLFLGPSGVGKTETAKAIAEIVYENPQALIRIDMSEFSESFNISKLIGAPAGYVGYKEGAKLTDAVRRRPYSVVLFDEIEKAHPDVFNLLLQVLEDGHLTDATGKKVNFKNTIIIMTSNLGSESLNKEAAIGFETSQNRSPVSIKEFEKRYAQIKEEVLKKLKEHFRPEFLNRIDQIIVFKPLTLKAVEKIVELQIKEVNERLKEQKLSLSYTPKVLAFIAKKAFSPETGAREVRKMVEEKIVTPLAEKILKGEIPKQGKIKVRIVKNKIHLTR